MGLLERLDFLLVFVVLGVEGINHLGRELDPRMRGEMESPYQPF